MFSVVILNHIKLYLENKMNNINFGQNAYDLSISESQYFDITLVLSVFNKKHKIKLNKFDCLLFLNLPSFTTLSISLALLLNPFR